ncbi:MAG: hypothetical protein JNM94_11560 [Phycisphaerae bacterium]|nr:hypothetical protein [Phycisphaerae bacterium]
MPDESTPARAAATTFAWVPSDALHVIPGDQPCTAALVADVLAARGGIAVILGTDAETARVRSLGSTLQARVEGAACPVVREPVLAARSLRRSIGTRAAPREIVAWGLDAAVTARVAWPARSVTAVLLDGGASPCSEWLARRGPRWRPHAVRAIGADVAARFAGLSPTPIDVFGPVGVDPSRLHSDRRAIRRRWGARPDECVVGLLGEPADRVDARRIAQLVGIAAVRGERVRLVVHPAACRREATERWLAGIDIPNFLIVDESIARPWDVVAGLDVASFGADAAIAAGRLGFGSRLAGLGCLFRARPGPVSPLPALWARAAGVPIVAERGALVDALARDLTAADVTLWDDEDAVRATRQIVAVARTLGADRSADAPTLCATPL